VKLDAVSAKKHQLDFAELQAKTCFSFLRGASHPSEMIERAAQLGLRAIAITDLNGVYGLPKAFRESKNHPALKLITGSEITFRDHPNVSFLAQNRKSYGLLCRIISAAHAGKPKGEASLGWDELLPFLEKPEAQGLFVLPRFALDSCEKLRLSDLKERLPGKIYLPLSRWLDGLDYKRTARIQQLSEQYEIPIVASNDAHYHVRERRMLHDVLTATRVGSSLRESGRNLFSNAERYLKGAAQMQKLFRDLPQALELSCEIADQCSFSMSELRYYYPSEWIPAGLTAQQYLEQLVWKGAEGRYMGRIPESVRTQIQHELKLVSQLKFADYFLTIWEIVEFARSRDILCQGRGSAANSILCYCLGITSIDPVRMNLLFERFISSERGEPPDIDVDFEHERREEVIQHVYEKYGRDRAGMVSAIITYRSRLALREVRKALEILAPEGPDHPFITDSQKIYKEASYRANGSRQPPPPGMTAAPGWDDVAESPTDEREQLALELAGEIYGFPRHLSIHSGGFTLSADPIIETVPIEPARMEGRTIVQWDKEDLDIIGLLKVDLLSLGMLTCVRKTLALIPGKPTMATLKPEDPATYDMICKADTVGTFQIESRAQMSMLPRLLPRTFYDLVIQIAIVRPGPIQGGMIHPYLRRRRGQEPVDMPHPALEPILRKTLGVPLFQEQVMKIAIVLADFTPGEADQLRRAIGAWRSSGSVDKWGKLLMERLRAKGLPQDFVERIFKQIQGFAEYGFPESHSASFALIAYASAYLKCHYPAPFLCGILNSQPMGFYSNHTLVEDAKRHGVRVLPVHPLYSEWDCIMVDESVRLGWRVVHGLGEETAKAICAERSQRPFHTLADFLTRTRLRSEVLQSLALSNAFECFGLEPREALWQVLAYAASFITETAAQMGQLALFSDQPSAWSAAEPTVPQFRGLSFQESIQADYATYGLSTRGHPMQAMRPKLPQLPKTTTQILKSRGYNGQNVALAGLVIVRQRPPTAKGTCFATLEDEHGFMDLIFHAPVFEKFEGLFWEHSFLMVTGKLQVDGGAINIIAKGIQPITISEP
jgi:error-prone DNA polymerase